MLKLFRKHAAVVSILSLLGVGSAWAQGQGATTLTPVTNTFTQTTTATLAAIPANPSRRQIQICGQTATNTLSLTFGTIVTPTSTLGIPIAAQSCTTFTPPAGEFYMGSQINLIAVTGSVVVLYTEWF
jgi:hypothetical protein